MNTYPPGSSVGTDLAFNQPDNPPNKNLRSLSAGLILKGRTKRKGRKMVLKIAEVINDQSKTTDGGAM